MQAGQRRGHWAGVPLEHRHALRREKLLAAGVLLLGREGGPALTVRAVCRHASLTERYFYESFTDRDHFVRAVYDDVCTRAMATLTSAHTPREAVIAAHPDQKVIGALVNTLNHDKNVNVRLASLYSLARFADNPAVRDSLVSSLPGQTEPLIQVVLINILAEKKEHRAIAPIRDILSKEKDLKEVREAAEKGLKKI